VDRISREHNLDRLGCELEAFKAHKAFHIRHPNEFISCTIGCGISGILLVNEPYEHRKSRLSSVGWAPVDGHCLCGWLRGCGEGFGISEGHMKGLAEMPRAYPLEQSKVGTLKAWIRISQKIYNVETLRRAKRVRQQVLVGHQSHSFLK